MEEKYSKIISFPGVKPDAYTINQYGVICQCDGNKLLHSNKRYIELETTDGTIGFFDIKSLLYWEFIEHFDMRNFYISYDDYDVGAELVNLIKYPSKINNRISEYVVHDVCKSLANNNMSQCFALREFPVISQAHMSNIMNGKNYKNISGTYFCTKNIKAIDETVQQIGDVRLIVDRNIISSLQLHVNDFVYKNGDMIFKYNKKFYTVSTIEQMKTPCIVLQNDTTPLIIITFHHIDDAGVFINHTNHFTIDMMYNPILLNTTPCLFKIIKYGFDKYYTLEIPDGSLTEQFKQCIEQKKTMVDSVRKVLGW